ncbi:MAG: hypothetical protein LKI53_04160 [Bacteroidales bacterium]|jgi:hypothetical protein|nr:hypothetical protein [Bacteroidales bacterium]
MKLVIISIIILGIGIIAMSITVWIKKGGKFPDSEISHNKAMRERGIICASAEEKILWKKKGSKSNPTEEKESDCNICGETSCIIKDIKNNRS